MKVASFHCKIASGKSERKFSNFFKFSSFFSSRSRPQTSLSRDKEVELCVEEPKVSINARPKTSYRAVKPVFTAAEIAKATEEITTKVVDVKPNYATYRLPLTPRFSSRLEKIAEEPVAIGDTDKDLSLYHKEINSLKSFIVITCEDTKKNLLNNIEGLTAKIDEHHIRMTESTKDKSRETVNLKMRNDALNTSLKHKAEENARLKREVRELKKNSETASSHRTDL